MNIITIICILSVTFVFIGAIIYLIKKKSDFLLSYNNEISNKKKTIDTLIEQINNYDNIINTKKEAIKESEKLIEDFEKEKEFKKKDYEYFEDLIEKSKNNYLENIEKAYINKENELDNLLCQYNIKIDNANTELNNIKNTINAGVRVIKEKKEKESELEFYKLQLPQGGNNSDLQRLIQLRESFSNPTVISKLIWSQYFQKQTTDLCNRVLGKTQVCGIYKITNAQTLEVYIGQSKNCQDRWKSHIKCGLGIDTPSTNKLYQNMLKYGAWNFIFQLLEECEPDKLDEKERLWIGIYDSTVYGLNTTKGNK